MLISQQVIEAALKFKITLYKKILPDSLAVLDDQPKQLLHCAACVTSGVGVDRRSKYHAGLLGAVVVPDYRLLSLHHEER